MKDTGLDISVVIPSWNRAACLPATVASVLAQTRQPREILVVDDGSTDDTEAVCARMPSIVRYIRKPNGGVASARNVGMAEARGEYIALLDADDIWLPDKLEVQATALSFHPEIGWLTANHVATDLDNVPLPGTQGYARDFPIFSEQGMEPSVLFAARLIPDMIPAAGSEHVVYRGDLFDLLFMGNVVLPSAAVIRRDLVQQVGGFREDFRVAEDTEFFHRCAAESQGGVIMTPLVLWRRGRSDTLLSSRNVVPLVRNALASLEGAFRRRPVSAEVEAAYRRGRRLLLDRLAYSQISVLDNDGARRTLRLIEREWGATARTRALRALAALPPSVLRALRRAKRPSHALRRLTVRRTGEPIGT